MSKFIIDRRTVVQVAVLAAMAGMAAAASAHDTQEVELPSVTSRSKINQGTARAGSLRDDIVKTESLDEAAIARTGATNINEALDKNPGISVQVECSICNVRNVLLNNLPGRYTTLMIDGVPIFSSVSSAYGLDSVSVYGLERIDVARGAGASLIAPEALSGVVNLVTKRPQSAENKARVQLGSFGSQQADAYLARTFDGGAVTATMNYNRHDSVDGDGNGVSEYSGYNRKLAGIGYFLDDVGGFRLRGRLDVVNEKRGGGAMGTDYAAIQNSSQGNPFNWSAGVHGSPQPGGWINPTDGSFIPYDSGRGGFSEIIFTDRVQWVTSGEKRWGTHKLRFALGAAQHEQDSFYELAKYAGKQRQYYAEGSWEFPLAQWMLTTGINYRYEDLVSRGATADGAAVDGIDNYTYRAPALYVQAYRTFFDDALEVNASLRHDRHNVFGGITTPRLNALLHHTSALSSRFSMGTGFRAPTSFFEQDHGILDTIRIERDLTKPEKSANVSYALSYADDRFAATASYNYTRIKNFALLDSGQVDSQGQPFTLFTSSPDPVTVQGIDLNTSYQLTPALNVIAAAEAYNYRFAPGTLVFARPRTRLYFGMDFDRGPWEVTAKLVLTGPMDLRKFHDDGSGAQNRFNLDGTPKRDKSPSFATLDVRAEYKLSKQLTLYAGVDNLFDYKQSDKESMLFVDAAGAPDVVHLWGPSRGRYVYAGLKLSF
jgi:outer membrane receptor for ferrienterochelin and colicins